MYNSILCASVCVCERARVMSSLYFGSITSSRSIRRFRLTDDNYVIAMSLLRIAANDILYILI